MAFDWAELAITLAIIAGIFIFAFIGVYLLLWCLDVLGTISENYHVPPEKRRYKLW